jgi:hypothetical protein
LKESGEKINRAQKRKQIGLRIHSKRDAKIKADIQKARKHKTTQHNTTQHNKQNTIQHNITQYSTTQHNTSQHNAAQYKRIQVEMRQGKTAQGNTKLQQKRHYTAPPQISITRHEMKRKRQIP